METSLINTLTNDKIISLFSDKFSNFIITKRSNNLIYCAMQFSCAESQYKGRVEFFIKEFKNKFVSSKVTVGGFNNSKIRSFYYGVMNAYISSAVDSLNDCTGAAPKCSN